MAQEVKGLATKTVDMSVMSEIYTVERKNGLTQVTL